MSYECFTCKAIFQTLIELNLHIKSSHGNQGLYSCLNCTFKSDKISSLENHKQMCVGKCQVCNVTFQNNHEMAFHDYINHSQGAPFNCVLCHETFVVKRSYLWHLHLLHKLMNPSKCEICNCSFQTNGMLQSHSIMNHPNQ